MLLSGSSLWSLCCCCCCLLLIVVVAIHLVDLNLTLIVEGDGDVLVEQAAQQVGHGVFALLVVVVVVSSLTETV